MAIMKFEGVSSKELWEIETLLAGDNNRVKSAGENIPIDLRYVCILKIVGKPVGTAQSATFCKFHLTLQIEEMAHRVESREYHRKQKRMIIEGIFGVLKQF